MIAPLLPHHLPAALALNRAHEAATSPLGENELKEMVAGALLALQSGEGADALLLAFDREADYHSPNFLWFKAKYDRFAYVDRVIVGEAAQGMGLARGLYEALFAAAAARGLERVVCEVNLDPPNPGSDAFHAKMGFGVVGQAFLPGNGKTVRYLSRAVTAAR